MTDLKPAVWSSTTGSFTEPSSNDYLVVGSGIKSSTASNSIDIGSQYGIGIHDYGDVTGTVTFDANHGNVMMASQTDDITLQLPDNCIPGQHYTFIIKQPAAGLKDITTASGSQFIFPCSEPLWDKGANAENVIQGVYDGEDIVCYDIGSGFSTGRGIYGDGAGGTIVVSTNTTMTVDWVCDSLTVNAGVSLDVGGCIICARKFVLNNGTITSAGNNASGSAAGAAKTWGSSYAVSRGGANGTTSAGGNGDGGTSTYAWWACRGGPGGSGAAGAGGSGPTAGSVSAYPAMIRSIGASIDGRAYYAGGMRVCNQGSGGSSGAGDGASKAGGGGGGSASNLIILAREIINSGTISATGGAGGAGASGGGATGGGGGGIGGVVLITCDRYYGAQPTAVGGQGGLGANGGGNGQAGTDGWVVVTYNR